MRKFTALFGRPKTRQAVIFEDDAWTADVYQAFLEEQGYVTQVFDDHEACRRSIRKQRPDLFICDVVNDHDEDGLLLLKMLYDDLGDLLPPVIIATALQTYQIRNHPVLRRVRKLRTLLKPFDMDEMLRTISGFVPAQ